MKTALVTTCWLGTPEYIAKTERWVRYYLDIEWRIGGPEIILLDNGSNPAEIIRLQEKFPTIKIQRFAEHMSRTSHLEYPYLWRAVDNFKILFEKYDKIIYTDNDFYVLSLRLMSYIVGFVDNWMSPWCPKHKFPETGLQVITKGSINYKISYPFSRFNGKCMELTLPVDIETQWKGDRYSEYEDKTVPTDADFAAQVTLEQVLPCVP